MLKGIDFIGVAVVNLCYNKKGEYLLGFRSDKCRDEHFTWEPIGSGGLKFGESVECGVKREVKEETGANVLQVELLGVFEGFREIDKKQTHWLYITNKVLIDESQVYIAEPEKCLEIRWCSKENFPDPLMSQFYPLLEKYKDKL